MNCGFGAGVQPGLLRLGGGLRFGDVGAATARQRLAEGDRARAQYVRRLYRADINDPELFHLHIDSTVLPLKACAQLIASAYRSLPKSGRAGW